MTTLLIDYLQAHWPWLLLILALSAIGLGWYWRDIREKP
mgnify:CR=1 FL=1